MSYTIHEDGTLINVFICSSFREEIQRFYRQNIEIQSKLFIIEGKKEIVNYMVSKIIRIEIFNER